MNIRKKYLFSQQLVVISTQCSYLPVLINISQSEHVFKYNSHLCGGQIIIKFHCFPSSYKNHLKKEKNRYGMGSKQREKKKFYNFIFYTFEKSAKNTHFSQSCSKSCKKLKKIGCIVQLKFNDYTLYYRASSALEATASVVVSANVQLSEFLFETSSIVYHCPILCTYATWRDNSCETD